MTNFIQITDLIFVSAAINNADLKEIKQHGISAIIDVRSEDKDDEKAIKELGMAYLNIPVDDAYTPTKKQLTKAINFANKFLDKNQKILVHCQNGYGRSPLIAIGILVNHGLEPMDAVGIIEDKHPFASFTPRQEKFIFSLKKNAITNL